MVVDDPAAARAVFHRIGIPVSETDVLGVELPNRPGAAADLCDRLAAKHVNIGYMYCTSGGKGGRTTVMVKVPDLKKAIKILEDTKSSTRDMKMKLRRPAVIRR
jgi:hypothetical protein